MDKDDRPRRKWVKVTVKHSAEIAVLHQKGNVQLGEIMKMYPQYSRRSVFRHMKKEFNEEEFDRRKCNKGRPKRLTLRDERRIVRTLYRLRRTEGNFNSKRLAIMAGVADRVSSRTVRRLLHKNGFHFLQARKKGLMKASDLVKRKAFCGRCKRLKLGFEFWTKGVSMYLDGKGFGWKQNPKDQALAPKGRIWRRKGEGLEPGCTARAGKAGTTNLNFMIGIQKESYYVKGIMSQSLGISLQQL